MNPLPAYLDDTLALLHMRALDHGGVFRRSDLIDWDVPDAALRALVRRRSLVRLRHGIYCTVQQSRTSTPAERHLLDLAAALRALEEPGFAFGRSAALLHHHPLPPSGAGALSIVRPEHADHRALQPTERRPRVPGVRARSLCLTSEEPVWINGIPTVGRLQAAVSAAATLPYDWAVGMLDAVLWRNEAGRDQLECIIADWARLRGIGNVRLALAAARSGAQTILESRSRVLLMRLGLPEPELQVPFYDDDGLIGYADMWFPDFNVIGEADGAVKYQDRRDLVKEKRREDRLRARGRRVVRWGTPEVEAGMHSVARQIRWPA